MEISYIISQIFVVMAMLSLGSSYLVKDKKIIMILCIICSLFYGVQYLLLGAISGMLMNLVGIIRDIWFYINAKNNKKNNIIVLFVLIIISILFSIYSFNGIFSIIPLVATILFTYSVWQDNNKIYRYLAIPISILWIIYNVYIYSVFAIISECILLIIKIIGVIKLYKSKE